MIDWDHGFPNIAQIPGSDNVFFHVLLPRDLWCSLIQVLLWDFHTMKFIFFFFVLNKALGKKKWWICLSQLMRKCRIFLVALCLEKWTLSAKTDAQFERCELSFIWGKMRTAAQETAPQITQKLLQRDSGGRSVWFWWRGSSVQSSTYFTKGFLPGKTWGTEVII